MHTYVMTEGVGLNFVDPNSTLTFNSFFDPLYTPITSWIVICNCKKAYTH